MYNLIKVCSNYSIAYIARFEGFKLAASRLVTMTSSNSVGIHNFSSNYREHQRFNLRRAVLSYWHPVVGLICIYH